MLCHAQRNPAILLWYVVHHVFLASGAFLLSDYWVVDAGGGSRSGGFDEGRPDCNPRLAQQALRAPPCTCGELPAYRLSYFRQLVKVEEPTAFRLESRLTPNILERP